MARPPKKPPSLLILPYADEVRSTFESLSNAPLIALEYERLETLSLGVCRAVSAFVQKPNGGSLTVNHIMPDAEPSASVMRGAAETLARTVNARFPQFRR